MANVFDYLKWRDDLKFDELKEVDVLVFNRLVYFPFEKVMQENEVLSIAGVYERVLLNKTLKCAKHDYQLLSILANSGRYSDLLISRVICVENLEKEEQFMAMTIHLPKNILYLVFRGTTDDVIGWKESLRMSYEIVPSQLDALNYLNKTNLTKRLYLGGHSKGGNLAMYSAVHANRIVQSRIVKVFNYDGPGFMELDNKYYSINKKIVSYLPSTSIIGKLLNIDHQVVIVQSDKKGFKEHNLYSWQVDKDKLVPSVLSKESDFFKKTIDKFVKRVSPVDRKRLLEEIFNSIEKTGAKQIKDIDFFKLKDILLSYRKLDNESKELLFNVFKVLFESTKDHFINKV